MDKVQRAAIYIRVSTAEQAIHGKSLQAQKEFLEKYALDHNMLVVGIYADEGQTARKELKKRKAIHALLGAVENNQIDVILFWKMDRWFRSVSDFYKVQDILDAHNVTWVAVAEPNMNMNTRDGRLSLNIMLSIGQNEVDTTSERIKFTVNNMIDNGRLVWGEKNMPFGYRIGEVDHKKVMVKDEATAPMVEEFYAYFEKHQSKSGTVKHMQDTFGIPFTYSMLRTMLTSEFYIGKYRECENYCPEYLTRERWSYIQQISKVNIKQNRSSRIYLFTSLITCPICNTKMCGCGCSSIICRSTGEKRSYTYYRCHKAIVDHQCANRHRVSQNLIEDYLLNNLDKEYHKFAVRCGAVDKQKKAEKKRRTKTNIKAEMDRLNLLFQKGRVDFEFYEKEYSKLEEELKDLVVELPSTLSPEQSGRITSILRSDFQKMYTDLSPENRQAFWRQLIRRIYLTPNSEVDYVDFL